ncbi:MAG TPA: TlpA family protein disulfide reductase [Anaerolineae bacterium]|nr:TlpA family protein disulfide reductase [Anaerolineae bacterium]
MKKLSGRNMGWLVLGGGLLLGIAVGLVVARFIAPGAGSHQTSDPVQASATSSPTQISTTTIVWPTTEPIEDPNADPESGSAGSPAPFVGEMAPDFEMVDVEGETLSLSELQGNVVLINFWATWCGPCRLEMPLLQDRYTRYADQGFEILAVSFDAPLDEVLDFKQEYELSFRILIDADETVQDLYRIRGFPTSVIVGRDGVIHTIHFGSISSSQLDSYLSQLGMGS